MNIENPELSRRTLVKGAAWSLPVIAVAAATPLAAASTANASVAWTGTNTNLLDLKLLDSATVLTASLPLTVPNQFTITNGAGAISEIADVTINVGRPGGINISLGTRRGFGVYSVAGQQTAAGERSYTYAKALGADVGFPTTTWSGKRNVTVASNGSLAVPVEFALAGTSTSLVGIQLLASYPVTLTVAFADGSSYTSSSSISVPVGAGVL